MSNDARGPRERAYDDHISPLMAQVIALCKEHGIPVLASFELDFEEEHGGALHCTTSLWGGSTGIPKPTDQRLERAYAAIRPPRPVALAITQTPTETTVTRVS